MAQFLISPVAITDADADLRTNLAGAVRTWDLRRAIEDTGENILSSERVDRLAAIGSFSLGDVYRGERALIV